MKIEVIRTDFSETTTIGTLMVDGEHCGFTCEDKVRENEPKVPGKTAIPYGTYDVIINRSNRFKRDLPLLLDVPGFAGVRIHSGNTAEDTEGCILVGNRKQTNRVLNSRITLNVLFQKMQLARLANEKITITITKGLQTNFVE
jgi:hypothetical protein